LSNLRIGVIGIPGKWSTEVLADKLEAKTGYRLVIDMADIALDLETKSLFANGVNLCELDGLVVKKASQVYSPSMLDRIELLRVAEASGVRVFSSADSILRLVDRLSCTISLRNANIPMPSTFVTENIEQAINAIKQYGSAVLKPLFSTKARGMTILESSQPEEELRQALTSFKANNPMMYLQQKLNLSGMDLGMVFIGGEYLCTYARVSQSDTWNTTIHDGGRYEDYQPTEALIALGRNAQKPFNLDFTTVDIALTDNGPIVFEVSAFGGFKGALEGSKVDAADAYSHYVLATLGKK
jgi:tetrahydromethanopterin:alpha-L-glutamate ligase